MNTRVLLVLVGLVAGCAAPSPTGADELAIFGGQTVADSDPIGKSAVFFTPASAMGHHGCSATILDDSHALTAMHCGIGLTADAVLMFGTRYTPDVVTRPTVDFVQPRSGDIAVVRFTGGLPPGYAPIPLAGATHVSAGARVVHAGYGQTSFTVNDRGTLRSTETRFTSVTPGQRIRTELPGHSICSGDSGGPDYVLVGGQLRQLGVHVTGDCASFAESTDVRVFTDWIRSTGAQPLVDDRPLDADR